jgi:hypothetical protein
VSKKKKPSAKKTRAGSASRRKSTSRSRSGAGKRRASPRSSKIQLKPIKVLIDRAIVNLQRLPPTEATDVTIKHLQTCSMAFGDICDPATPGGCGPDMEFPREGFATSR